MNKKQYLSLRRQGISKEETALLTDKSHRTVRRWEVFFMSNENVQKMTTETQVKTKGKDILLTSKCPKNDHNDGNMTVGDNYVDKSVDNFYSAIGTMIEKAIDTYMWKKEENNLNENLALPDQRGVQVSLYSLLSRKTDESYRMTDKQRGYKDSLLRRVAEDPLMEKILETCAYRKIVVDITLLENIEAGYLTIEQLQAFLEVRKQSYEEIQRTMQKTHLEALKPIEVVYDPVMDVIDVPSQSYKGVDGGTKLGKTTEKLINSIIVEK